MPHENSTNYIDRFEPRDLLEEYHRYPTALGRAAILSRRPEIIHLIPYAEKQAFLASFVTHATQEQGGISRQDLHQACAHLAIELYRGAYIVALEAVSILPPDSCAQMRQIVFDSRLSDTKPAQPTSVYHNQLRSINSPQHADAQAPQPPQDIPRDR